MADTSLFYKRKKGFVPFEEWEYFCFDELKTAVVRLVGPPIRTPEERFAVHCFDRSDGLLKVLEGPYELFEQFAAYQKNTKRNPSGPDAPDFRMALMARPFRYLVTATDATPLSEAEKVALVSRTLDLATIYKTGSELNRWHVMATVGVWPKPVWPSEFQTNAEKAEPDRLAADGVIIRFPSRDELQ